MAAIIRDFQISDISAVSPLPPEEWHFPISDFILQHFEQPYFSPFVLCEDDTVVGFGNSIRNNDTAWLGNIIVHADHRKKGYGSLITRHLIDHAGSLGVTSFILIATEMGRPVYEKIGFVKTSDYIFYKRETTVELKLSTFIQRLTESDHIQTADLDHYVSGEERDLFIRQFLPTAYCIKMRNELEGVYFKKLGNGLIIARSTIAGLALLSLRIAEGAESLVIPEENTFARDYIQNVGFKETMRLPRMVYGYGKTWHPECVYNRGAGYCG